MPSSNSFETTLGRLQDLLPRLADEHNRVVAEFEEQIRKLEAQFQSNPDGVEGGVFSSQTADAIIQPACASAPDQARPHQFSVVRRTDTDVLDERTFSKKKLAILQPACASAPDQASPQQCSVLQRMVTDVLNERTFSKRKLGLVVGAREHKAWYRLLEAFFVWVSALVEPERHGCLAAFERSHLLNFFTSGAICAQVALTIYTTNWQLEHLGETPSSTINAISYCLLSWFVIELVLKFTVHRFFFFVGTDGGWNCFDFALVAGSSLDLIATSIAKDSGNSNISFLRIIRLLRLTRVLRLLRVLRFLDELRLMVVCLLRSVCSLIWCVVLIVFVTSFFAMLLTFNVSSWLSESGRNLDDASVLVILQRFSSVQAGLLLLIQVGLGGVDWAEVYDEIVPTGTFNCFAILVYVVVFHVSLLNIINGMFLEKTLKVGQPETDSRVLEKHWDDIAMVKKLHSVVVKHLDLDRSGDISMAEFRSAMDNPEVRAEFEVMGVPINDAEVFYNVLSSDDEHAVPIDTFIAGCLRMKGFAMSSDLQAVRMEGMRRSSQLTDIARLMQDQLALLNVLQRQVSPSKESQVAASGHREKNIPQLQL